MDPSGKPSTKEAPDDNEAYQMHDIEPYYSWQDYYNSEEDERSPFYGVVHSEMQFSTTIYNYYIHPQWDDIGSSTLYIKVIYADYTAGFAVLELIGEWNDCLHNDIMFLKRDIIDHMIGNGITKFALIGENVLNFHASDDSYYEEWFSDIDNGWITMINFREHVLSEFARNNIDYYFMFGGELNHLNWRTLNPADLLDKIESICQRRLG